MQQERTPQARFWEKVQKRADGCWQWTVTQAENVRRAHRDAKRTHCVNGHAYTPENVYVMPSRGWRQCRTCMRARARKAYQRSK